MSILHFYLIFILIIFNLFNLFLIKFLSKKYNLYDEPNHRKLHTEPTSYLGGILFFLSNFIYLTYFKTYLFESHFLIYNFSHIYSLIFISSLIFFIGLLDDKIDLNPLKKTIIFIILISSAVLIDSELVISKLNFEIINKTLNLKGFSVLFTILCIYIFINSCNMYDGADLQLGLYFLIVIFYLIFKSGYVNIFIPLIIPLIIFLLANFKKFCFLGNNGSHFLGYIIAAFIIKFYNIGILFHVEQVLILMLVPGLDLVRLFFSRLLNNRKFFVSDLNHIHHILSKNRSKYSVQLIIIIMNISPIIVGELTGSYLAGIIIGILSYYFIIFKKVLT